jgi:hypothetical protein
MWQEMIKMAGAKQWIEQNSTQKLYTKQYPVSVWQRIKEHAVVLNYATRN